MKHCYWDDTGKYQTLVDELDERTPRFGYTSNAYVNLYLAMSHLYYDAYNNGGGNIPDCYMQDVSKYVTPHLPTISARPFIYCDFEKMEQIMDMTMEFIQDKDLSFPVYTVWLNYEQDTLSRMQPPAAELNNWTPVTFGEEDRLHNYCLRRTGNSNCRDVTEEIRTKTQAHPDLDSVIQNATAASAKANNESLKSMQPEGR